MISLLLAGHLLHAPVPPPEPQGTDLLWSQALAFDADGMPVIPLGIREGQARIEVILRQPATLLLGQRDTKEVSLPAGARASVTLRSSRAAKVRHFVIAEQYPIDQREQAQRRLKYWRALGYESAQLLPLGVQMALSGTAFDNRSLALAVAFSATAQGAENQRQALQAKHQLRTHIEARLIELPSGTMEVRVGAQRWIAKERVGLRFARSDARAQLTLLNAHKREARSYRGAFEFVLDAEGRLAAVGLIRAEELVAGTVPAESYATAPLEALKSQAIAARTELFSKLGTRHGANPFLLCDDQDCQVYRGVGARHPNTDRATQETKGQLLFDHTKPLRGAQPLAHAQYSAICGGHTEDNDAVWNQSPSPLLRGLPDGRVPPPPTSDDAALSRWIESDEASPWCQVSSLANHKMFRWTRTLNGKRLKAVEKALGVGALRALTITERGVSGRARSLIVRGTRGQTVLEPELRIRRALGNLPSSLFTMKLARRGQRLVGVTFRGRGWGHGVGMCQMGAIGMAEAGYDNASILKHYYPGSSIQTVY
ncbi:MAG: SpoIID/LytB domain-containing protein [Myxococcota bacterium]|nr:SpoIID/LytB domain-containing protein [Myxococcota bacterium]